MGVDDVGIIGVGKDAYNEHLPGMVNGRILSWVEDVQAAHADVVGASKPRWSGADFRYSPSSFGSADQCRRTVSRSPPSGRVNLRNIPFISSATPQLVRS